MHTSTQHAIGTPPSTRRAAVVLVTNRTRTKKETLPVSTSSTHTSLSPPTTTHSTSHPLVLYHAYTNAHLSRLYSHSRVRLLRVEDCRTAAAQFWWNYRRHTISHHWLRSPLAHNGNPIRIKILVFWAFNIWVKTSIQILISPQVLALSRTHTTLQPSQHLLSHNSP